MRCDWVIEVFAKASKQETERRTYQAQNLMAVALGLSHWSFSLPLLAHKIQATLK